MRPVDSRGMLPGEFPIARRGVRLVALRHDALRVTPFLRSDRFAAVVFRLDGFEFWIAALRQRERSGEGSES